MTTTPFEAASRLAAEANINANGRKPTGGKRFEPATDAKRMIEEGLIVAKGGGQLFMYDPAPGIYVAAEARLLETLAKRLDTEWQPSRADAVVRYLFDTAQILWERPPLDKVNVSNGILDIASGDLEPHNPEYLTYVQIPVAWRPRADCPRVRQFVDEVFPFDAPVLAYEVAGCLLVPDLRFQRSVLLLGAGQNGKGVFLKLLIAMLGKQNVSRVSLKELADDRFATADLHGKLANVFSDLPDTHIKDSSMFKVLTGDEGRIRAQRKHGQPFEFEPFARLVFSANRVPGSRDTTFGYLRRWLVVEFPNQFVGDANDRSLADKLTTKDELSGFLRFSVEYYRDMVERGNFTVSNSVSKAKQKFIEGMDPVAASLNQMTRSEPDAKVARPVLFRHYKAWCEDAGHHPVSARRFNEAVTRHRSVDCWQSAQVGQIRTREDYYYEELRGSSLRVLL